jgi:hypothetical protein
VSQQRGGSQADGAYDPLPAIVARNAPICRRPLSAGILIRRRPDVSCYGTPISEDSRRVGECQYMAGTLQSAMSHIQVAAGRAMKAVIDPRAVPDRARAPAARTSVSSILLLASATFPFRHPAGGSRGEADWK